MVLFPFTHPKAIVHGCLCFLRRHIQALFPGGTDIFLYGWSQVFSAVSDSTVRREKHSPQSLFIYLWFHLFWDKGITCSSMMNLELLCSSGWPWTPTNPPVSAPQVQRSCYIQTCMHVCMDIYMNSMYTMRNFRNSEVTLGCFLVWTIGWHFSKRTS